jgi:ATP-binding cassette subfamily F protein uup
MMLTFSCSPVQPTNHLSLEGVEWLEGHLREAQRSLTLVMVTHDRAFLDAVCSDLLELDGTGGFWFHSGGYGRYLAGREERYHAQAAAAAGAVTLLRKESVWMAKQPKARLAKSQSRQDAFYELQDQAAAVPERMGTIDAAAAAVMSPRLGDIIVELKDASLRLGTTRVLHNFTHMFRRGERVGLVGANGAGKSSFLGVCTGQLAVDSGTVTIGETVRFGHYTQMFDFPDPNQRVADYVAQLGADARELVKRLQAGASGATLAGWSTDDLMDRFQFAKGRQAVPIGKLSGGERRRLQLLTVLSTLPNFLLLDEISNDLDLDTIEAIEAMLAGFGGVILIAGHDRAFLDALVQHIFVFKGDGVITDFHGTYSQLRAAQSSGGGGGGGASPPPGKTNREAAPASASPDARRVASNAAKKLPKVEAELVKLDVQLAAVDEQLIAAAADAGEAMKLATQRQALVDKQEELFQEYSKLDALARTAA